MKILLQFAVILSIWVIGMLISTVLSPYISFPGTIIGLILFTALLGFGFIKERQIRRVSNFFLDNMAFFFVPAAVGIVAITGLDTTTIIKILFLVIITTIITMIATSLVTHFLIKLLRSHK